MDKPIINPAFRYLLEATGGDVQKIKKAFFSVSLLGPVSYQKVLTFLKVPFSCSEPSFQEWLLIKNFFMDQKTSSDFQILANDIDITNIVYLRSRGASKTLRQKQKWKHFA